MNPFRIGGHWRRESIAAPGMEDRTTRVHWLQAEVGFCDIRIPLTRPDVAGGESLSELPVEALLGLMNSFGFAGETELHVDCCIWHRQISFHGSPPGASQDIGILRHGPGGRMIEDGAEGAYREVWALEGRGPYEHGTWSNGERACRITWGPSDFLLAFGTIGAPDSLPLRQALEAGERPEAELAAFFDAEYTLGYWDGDVGVAQLSTNPLREGHAVLSRRDLNGARMVLGRRDFFGVEVGDVWMR
ncbi:hypothetical protein [Pseudoruegeria sp. HB172150]|uniref:hypothetical protein n=1 Tax=Pseudoruegeria sp. HB172150 TaxID=2721164 RepID=UPI001555B2B3|nr:hypothetical protein [Pseudoruegeria sp. HB172150]